MKKHQALLDGRTFNEELPPKTFEEGVGRQYQKTKDTLGEKFKKFADGIDRQL